MIVLLFKPSWHLLFSQVAPQSFPELREVRGHAEMRWPKPGAPVLMGKISMKMEEMPKTISKIMTDHWREETDKCGLQHHW